MKQDAIAGLVGTSLGVLGTATQTNETLETISLIITIIGAVFSFIVVPLLNWLITAKKDGKITKGEIKEGAEILKDGIDKTREAIGPEEKEESNDADEGND